MTLRLAGALLGLLWTLSPSAQTLSGRITDASTGQPLPGAAVALPSLGLGTATDAEGRYSLTVPAAGSVRVVVRYIGYTAQTRVVNLSAGPAQVDAALSPSIVEAPEVTVTARSRASDVLSTPQSVAAVDGDALVRAGGATPMQALDGVAGVRLLSTGPGIAKPVVRGLTAQRVLVVNDGVRQEGQGWGDEHGPEIGAADVDRIEVVRGPASLLYGSDALGGVVQTIQGDVFGAGAPLAGEVRASGLTVAQQGDATVRLGGTQGAWGYEGRAGWLRAGQVRTPDGLIPNTALETGTLGGRIGRRLSGGGSVEVEGGAFRQRLGLFEPGEGDGLGRHEIGEPYQDVEHDRGAVKLSLPIRSAGTRLDVTTALQQNRRREFEGTADPALFLRLTTGTVDARLHHRPLGRVVGTVGVSGFAQRNATLAEETLIPSGTTVNGSLYVTEELVLDALTLDAGLRVDVRRVEVEDAPDLGVEAQTRSYAALTGAVGAAWQPRPDLSLAVNLGRAFRAPVLQELFGNGVHEGTLRFERGDPTLTPETSLALDGVVRYLTPHVYAEAGAFLNTIGGYIYPRATSELDGESGFVVYDFTQADARLAGVDGRLDIHPHALHGLGLHFAGDVTRGLNRETDAPLPFVPPARLQTAVEYQARRAGPLRDVEARFGPTFVAAQNRPDVPDEVPTDGFTTWDASASASVPVGAVTVSPTLAVLNLTDQAYVDPLSRYRPFGLLAPGRSVRVSVRVAF